MFWIRIYLNRIRIRNDNFFLIVSGYGQIFFFLLATFKRLNKKLSLKTKYFNS